VFQRHVNREEEVWGAQYEGSNAGTHFKKRRNHPTSKPNYKYDYNNNDKKYFKLKYSFNMRVITKKTIT
jgi:hypothetical protein